MRSEGGVYRGIVVISTKTVTTASRRRDGRRESGFGLHITGYRNRRPFGPMAVKDEMTRRRRWLRLPIGSSRRQYCLSSSLLGGLKFSSRLHLAFCCWSEKVETRAENSSTFSGWAKRRTVVNSNSRWSVRDLAKSFIAFLSDCMLISGWFLPLNTILDCSERRREKAINCRPSLNLIKRLIVVCFTLI